MKTTDKLPNYRIYDRTGGGVTEDIYAETLEDAIEAGRDWIEAGDWSSEDGIYRTTILPCCVREIVRYDWAEGIEVEAGEGDDYDTGIINTMHADGKTCTVAWASGVTTPCDLSVLSRADGETNGEINEDATADNDDHDCSGEYSDELPECDASDNGEHDWQSPYSLVGGIKENPGVWSRGGTCMTYKEVCANCGKYKSTTNKGSQCNRDEARLVIEIKDADEDSLAWVASCPAET